MSIPVNENQMDSLIDQVITSKSLFGSIKQIAVGSLLKKFRAFISSFFIKLTEKGAANGVATLDGDGKLTASQRPPGGGGDGSGSTVKSFPKSASLTSAHIGLLAMQKVQLKEGIVSPTSIDDFDIEAVLNDTVPATPGEKGVYRLEFGNIMLEQPKTKIIRVEFLLNPNEAVNYLGIGFMSQDGTTGYGDITFKDSSPNSSNNEVLVGSDIAATIANINTHFTTGGTTLTDTNVKIIGTGSNYIDFEMLYNVGAETIMYKADTKIIASGMNPDNFFTSTTRRELNLTAALNAEQIYAQGDNYLINVSNWDTDGSGRSLINYAKIFRNDSGQPYGTVGAFGLRYFANAAQAINAIQWALTHTVDGDSVNWFSTAFDVTVALAETDDNYFAITVRNKTAPLSYGDNYFNTQSGNYVTSNTVIIDSATSGLPPKAPYACLGKIVGIDGDNVLIDSSFVIDVTLCSAEDGAFGILPYNQQFQSGGFVIAWAGGKVIDLAGYQGLMGSLGYTGDNISFFPFSTGGVFRVLTAGTPDGTLTVDHQQILFQD